MVIKNKRVLITAGPTWIPIDNVRVIANTATGKTGILLAKELRCWGAKVTLLLGPVGDFRLNAKTRVLRFKYFEELRNKLKKELKSKKYDIVIHSAAVSDYRPKIFYRQKIKSDKKNWRLNLVPLPKIIDMIKKINASVFLVGFKFEPEVKKTALLKEARVLIQQANLNLAVANTIDRNRYCAYIVNRRQVFGPLFNKQSLVKKLVRLLITRY
jgi:phosphopantothenoylcysteine decarboxylase/phosphopantothenate--cysteine ligase